MNTRTRFIVLAALLSLAMATILPAQTITTGEIAGVITDPTGAVVANAKVALKSDEYGVAQSTNSSTSGEFRFNLLRPGAYILTVTAAGFQESAQKVSVNLGQVARIPIQLGLQSQSQIVNVSEQAALVQSENANIATTFDSKQLENLPAPGNDMTAYAFTAPGVSASTGGGYGSFSAFGLPAVSNLFTINGNDNMDPYLNLNNSGASNLTLGANEIQEAAVVVNGYTGQYGRQAGAQVNYITRSGTNQFHGNASWQWNGSKLNANDFFNNASGTARPHAVSNMWADSLGGPVIKNKLFFYFDNEGMRYVLPSGGPVYIPTSDFSNYVLTNLQQTNASAVPLYTTAMNLWKGSSGYSRANAITSATDPALGCGDFSGTAGFGTGGKPCASVFQSTVNSLNTEWLMAVRVDYNLSDKDRLSWRYNTDHGIQATGTDPINSAFNANSVQPSYGGQMNYNRTITPTIVNDLRASASYYSAIFGPPDFAGALKTFPTVFAFGDGVFNNLGGSDNNYPSGRKVRQWQLIDDLSIIKGRHNIKFGTNIRKNFVATFATLPNTSGAVSFQSMTDFVNGSLDNGSTYSQAFPQVGAQRLTMYSAGFYGQDEWKVRPNLTVTLALRFDRNSNISCDAKCFNEILSPFGSADHTATTPYNQIIKTGLSQAFPSIEPMVVQPRIGVAYSIRKSTVLRGGFGIFPDLYPATVADRFITNAPGVSTFTTSSGIVAPGVTGSAFANVANSNAAFVNGFNSGATYSQLASSVKGFSVPNFNSIANKLYNPKFYEWNFEIEQAITNNYMLSVNYVGNHGWDNFNQTANGNAWTKAGSSIAGVPTSAPDARFGGIREINNAGYSNYDGLITSLKWRVGSQFSGQFSYTWSHALDTCSNDCLLPFNALTAVSLRYQVSPYGPGGLNYSNADYDVRHTWNANYVYTVPTSYFGNSILKHALGNWTVSGTFQFHTGYPFSVVTTGVRSRMNNVSSPLGWTPLAEWIGGSSLPTCTSPDAACLTTAQFNTAANQHTMGNLPRNSFRGPNYFNSDFTIRKTVALKERYKFTIGAYMFNVFNHVNFDLPVNSLTSGAFGQIQSTVAPYSSAYGSFQGSAVSGRIIQTIAKFEF